MTWELWLVVCIIGALAIVAFAVGVPYAITHRGLRSPYSADPANRAETRAYFRLKRRRQGHTDTAPAQPERAASNQGNRGSPSA